MGQPTVWYDTCPVCQGRGAIPCRECSGIFGPRSGRGLELRSYEVTAVSNGVAVLEQLVTLLRLDRARPATPVGSRGGFEEEPTRRGLRPGLRVVVLSAGREGEEGQGIGADGYLRKPLQFCSLVRGVARRMRT